MFHGSLVALVTPMHNDGSIDYVSLEKLLEWHIKQQTDGLIILGTTGESATIEEDERIDIIRFVIQQVDARLPIIVGTGSNSTRHTVHLTEQAMELGADAALIVTPYYNKPTQEGLFQHYSVIANSVPIPQILYNVPSRTGCDLLPETVLRLADQPNIVGLKDATGDLTRLPVLVQAEIDLYSGDDPTSAEFMLKGGKGVISVVANICPRQMHELCEAALNGDRVKTEQLNQALIPIYKPLFCESNPIAPKWALHEMGLIEKGIRLPLTWLNKQFEETVREGLYQTGCLKEKMDA